MFQEAQAEFTNTAMMNKMANANQGNPSQNINLNSMNQQENNLNNRSNLSIHNQSNDYEHY